MRSSGVVRLRESARGCPGCGPLEGVPCKWSPGMDPLLASPGEFLLIGAPGGDPFEILSGGVP